MLTISSIALEVEYTIPKEITSNITELHEQNNQLKVQIEAIQGQENQFKTQIAILDEYTAKIFFKIELIAIACVLFLGVGIGMNILLIHSKTKEFFELMKIRYDVRPISEQLKEEIPQLEASTLPKLPKMSKIKEAKPTGEVSKGVKAIGKPTNPDIQ